MIAQRNYPNTNKDVLWSIGVILLVITAVAISIWVGLSIAKYYTTDHSEYRQPTGIVQIDRPVVPVVKMTTPAIPHWVTAVEPAKRGN